MGAVRTGALVLYGLLIATGALASPALSVICGTACGAVGSAVVAALLRHPSADVPPLPHPALAAAVAAGLPAALAGSSAIGPWAGLLVVLLVIVAAGLLGRWIGSSPRVGPRRAGTPDLGARDDDLLRALVAALPTDVLLGEWQVTQRHLSAGFGDLGRDVRLRELLIDELQARDPRGTARWLTEGLTSPPDRYIRRDPSLGS